MIIYLARNRMNGKAYVGKTERTLEQRTKEHLWFAEKGSPQPFHRAIRKHGAEAFEWSVLCTLSSDCDGDDLNLMECHYIEKMGTFSSNGYNATRGGDGVRGWSPSPEHREKIRQAHLGEKNHNFGKSWGHKGPFSEESKQKMREAALGRKHSDETRKKIAAASSVLKRKAVAQVSKEGTVLNVYPSLQEAAQAVGGQVNKISGVLCGHRRTHKGYIWQYALEGGQTADRVKV